MEPQRFPGPRPVVHLELHTNRARRALEFYERMFGWRGEVVEVGSARYTALSLGAGLGGGIVECSTARALWLPYIDVGDIRAATRRAVELGAEVLLAPREGVAGWRSVVRTPCGGEAALWQAKDGWDLDCS
jgi:predicted enzyme related to lactoylglutathione lyase